MFRTNAFGQRVLCNPYLRFIKKPDDDGAGGGAGVELDGETFDFPSETPVADMTPEQKAEYWRHESKKQQKKAPKKPADYDQLQADSVELARIRAEQTPEDERERQAAVDAARREGENIGAERYLKEAVKGRFQAFTGKSDEEVEKAFAHVDATSFVDDDGNVDSAAIKEFVESLGLKASTTTTDPVRDALSRQKPAGTGGGGQSMSERREAARDRMTKKKTTT